MKSTLLSTICALFLSILTFGQTSTEQYETESNGSTSFTDNGVMFNIISNVNTYDIQAAYPGTGWNGTSADNRYIDNSGAGNQSAGTSFSIKTTSNLFKVNRFWVYAAAANTTLGVAGTLTITGKLSGVTKFTQTKTTGFTATTSTANGYTLIDMTNLNGQNYSNIVIDQLQITAGGNFQYLALDAFTWVKDPGIVLAANEVRSSKKDSGIYPNPTSGPLTIKTEENSKFEVYSQNGQLVKTIETQKGTNESDISDLPKGVYTVKSSKESYKIIRK
ncbi:MULTISPECIES: T9SS type A sorting domain-containing protein [unclassified Chryseobacterium]|uniref:T9SS type A sorting domain-containing protein n=1 Tax=unclassified Chryseobacterium TaxID=2593645 RepID=UPI000D37FC1A|nr:MULTISPECIES: T9SS type A sorting domain-containing protein [unclassified Chryseobacterium]PTT71100.1 secretion protein [Chryseobacterium sp. HMWF001]PVV50814.1 T9SS C-terminal target domain-containing protein [Chryseobacterium sp. HMWF035]